MSNIKTENDFCEKFNTLLKEYKEEITSFPELEKQYSTFNVKKRQSEIKLRSQLWAELLLRNIIKINR